MFQRESVVKGTKPGVLKWLLLFPFLLVLAGLLFFLPWANPNAPAWVQAVGSIAAILAAWQIPYQHERLRAQKQKEDLLASVSWLALRVKNSFDHMAGVIKKSDVDARNRWLFLASPLDWSIHRDAAREIPLTGFTYDEISWLLSLRAITEFGVLCAESLRTWDFEARPHLAKDFPYNDGIEFHRPQIEWVLKRLPLRAPAKSSTSSVAGAPGASADEDL